MDGGIKIEDYRAEMQSDMHVSSVTVSGLVFSNFFCNLTISHFGLNSVIYPHHKTDDVIRKPIKSFPKSNCKIIFMCLVSSQLSARLLIISCRI